MWPLLDQRLLPAALGCRGVATSQNAKGHVVSRAPCGWECLLSACALQPPPSVFGCCCCSTPGGTSHSPLSTS